jgi:glycerol-3-phosphate acyltransferase PlsY
MKFVALAVGAYLLGSVPFAMIIARLHGKNLRIIGSGNIGATNLARAVGKKWAYVCFLLDVCKGLVPAATALALSQSPPQPSQLSLTLMVGFMAVIGHVFPVYIRFKGGKGVATSFGVALGLWPYYTIAAAIALAVWLAVALTWRYISLASIAAAATFPIALTVAIFLTPAWRFHTLWPLLIAATAIPLLVIIRHRTNIKRLLQGTETKVLQKKKDQTP